MNVVSASWVLGWNNKGMVSKAYSPPLHPVLLPFGGHGEHRQIVIGIDDAVLEILLTDTDTPARTPLCRSSRIALLALDKMRLMVVFSRSCGSIELAARVTEFSSGASKAKGAGSRSRTRPYASRR